MENKSLPGTKLIKLITVLIIALMIPALTSCSSDKKDKDDMETLLTPRNATKIVTTPRSLTLNSDQSLADLVAFYEKALKKLDAEQTSRIELKGWYYTGRYDSSKYITISISYIESKDHHLIVISY